MLGDKNTNKRIWIKIVTQDNPSSVLLIWIILNILKIWHICVDNLVFDSNLYEIVMNSLIFLLKAWYFGSELRYLRSKIGYFRSKVRYFRF